MKNDRAIKFGTSGWRGIIAEDFNFENLRTVSFAVCEYLKSLKAKNGVVVGYDTRFLGKMFAQEVVLCLASHGIKSFITNRDVPTPALSAFIIENKLDAGINITASHNPYQYSGFKFSPSWGGPALPDDTQKIEAYIKTVKSTTLKYESIEDVVENNLCEVVDPMPVYIEFLKKNLNFKKNSDDIEIFYDAVYGTGREYVSRIFSDLGVKLTSINENPDPYFAMKGPEPSDENLSEIKLLVKASGKKSIGIATDGDADRFGIIDSSGNFVEPNKIIALLADYLYRTREFKKGIGVARSFATGSLLDLVAKKYDLKTYVNPVGFKYIGKLISENKIIIGGEESAGLSVYNHVPEKDGILACLLVVEAMMNENSTIEELLEDLYKRVGRVETQRKNYHVKQEIKENLTKRLLACQSSFLNRKIDRIEDADGIKFTFEDASWVLFRESGTEPVVRVYGEDKDDDSLSLLMESAQNFIFEKN